MAYSYSRPPEYGDSRPLDLRKQHVPIYTPFRYHSEQERLAAYREKDLTRPVPPGKPPMDVPIYTPFRYHSEQERLAAYREKDLARPVPQGKPPMDVPIYTPFRCHSEQDRLAAYREQDLTRPVPQDPRSEKVRGCEDGLQRGQNKPTGARARREDEHQPPGNVCTLKRSEAVRVLHSRTRTRTREREMDNSWSQTGQEQPRAVPRKQARPEPEASAHQYKTCMSRVLPTDDGVALELMPVTDAEILILKDFRSYQGRQHQSFYIHMSASQLDVDQEPGSLWEFAHDQEQIRVENVRCQTAAALGSGAQYAMNEKSAYFDSVKDRGRGSSSTGSSLDSGYASPMPNSHATSRIPSKPRPPPTTKSPSRMRGSLKNWIRIF